MTKGPATGRQGSAAPLRTGIVRALGVLAAISGLTVAGLAPATAQSLDPGSVDPGSLVPSVPPGSLVGVPSLSVAALTQLGAPIPITSVLGSVGAVGSGDFPRPESSSPPGAPRATRDPAITSSAVRSVEQLFPGSADEADRRAEVWTVTSKSMQRAIRVEVYRAPDGVDAPNVYFLDGVGSEVPSGWSTGMGWGDRALRDKEMNVIVPTGGPASMWSDWQADDPVLGPNNWETFLTEELPPLLETGIPGSVVPLAHNGGWGVMGLSMGASAALHLANRNEMFDAVAGVSGAYSTTDELGYQYARLTVAARHGDVTNMWGPRGSRAWVDHDTAADPSGLAGKAVYLSAATGLVGSSELGRFGSNELVLVDGHVLEKGSYESTRRLEAALAEVPGVDLRMNYIPTGIHNWPVFVSQMRPGMEHVLSGLPKAVPNQLRLAGAAVGGGVGAAGSGSASAPASLAGGSGGSSGSTGSTGSTGSGGS